MSQGHALFPATSFPREGLVSRTQPRPAKCGKSSMDDTDPELCVSSLHCWCTRHWNSARHIVGRQRTREKRTDQRPQAGVTTGGWRATAAASEAKGVEEAVCRGTSPLRQARDRVGVGNDPGTPGA